MIELFHDKSIGSFDPPSHPALNHQDESLDSLEQITLFTEQLAREFFLDEPDRRGAPRCQVTIPIEVDPLDDQQQPLGFSIAAISRDMSSTGIGLVCRDPIHSKYARLRFELPSKTKIDVIGQVLRCKPIGYYFNVGIQYLSLSR